MYLLWKLKEFALDLIDPERSIPNTAPHYRTVSHIKGVVLNSGLIRPRSDWVSCETWEGRLR